MFSYHAFHPVFGTDVISQFASYVFQQSHLSMDVFFVLSSFLLTLLGLMEYKKRGTFSFRKFFIRRVLRIWPLYYSILILAFLIFPLLASRFGFSMSLPEPEYYFFFIANFYRIDHVFFLRIFWSISVEEQFYFLLGICLTFFIKHIKAIFLVLAGISIFFSIWATQFSVHSFTHTITYFFDFGVGGLGAWLYHTESRHIARLRNIKSLPLILFYCYIPFHFLLFFILEKIYPSDYIELTSRYIFILYTGVLILEQLVNHHRSTFLEKNKFLIYTGKISFGLYCFHGMVITFLNIVVQKAGWNVPTFYFGCIAFAVNYVIGWASYTYFESPFLKLKSKLSGI